MFKRYWQIDRILLNQLNINVTYTHGVRNKYSQLSLSEKYSLLNIKPYYIHGYWFPKFGMDVIYGLDKNYGRTTGIIHSLHFKLRHSIIKTFLVQNKLLRPLTLDFFSCNSSYRVRFIPCWIFTTICGNILVVTGNVINTSVIIYSNTSRSQMFLFQARYRAGKLFVVLELSDDELHDVVVTNHLNFHILKIQTMNGNYCLLYPGPLPGTLISFWMLVYAL